MTPPANIVIVGAGLAGLTLAAQLAASDYSDALSIRVVDAGKRPSFEAGSDVALRVSAIASATSAVFDALGVWNAIATDRLSPYERMRVWDERDTPDGDGGLLFDAAEYALPSLGHIVENIVLQDALLSVLDSTNVDVQFDTAMTAMPDADLVVAADGANSKIRQLAAIRSARRPFDQVAVVTHVTPAAAHQRTALQRFMKDGPLGLLPLNDGRLSVVWSTRPETAAIARNASRESLSEMLTHASDFVLGDLKVSAPSATFALGAQHAETYIASKLVLVGDAAHAVHPLAGQGANLGIQDTTALVEAIEHALSNGLAIGDRPVLRRYERARMGANLAMLHFTTGLNRLFATDLSPVAELRAVGMRVFNRSGPLKERAVKVALGIN